MIRRIKNRIFPKSNQLLVEELKRNIAILRKTADCIVLYGSPTEGNWKGIANATHGLFPANSIQIPQWYSNPVLNDSESTEILETLAELKFKKIIVSGFANYFFEWIDYLKDFSSIEIIFHGTISEFHEKEKQLFIGKLIELGQNGTISKFGFVKEGMDQVFQKLYNFDCFHQPLLTPQIPLNLNKIPLDKSKFHIGVFGADTFNKNLHNQVIHALMIEDVVVHVLDKSIFNYLQLSDRIVEHGKNLDKIAFLSVLGSMDLNLYISFNESWGLVSHESQAMGVPCVESLKIDYLKLIREQIERNK